LCGETARDLFVFIRVRVSPHADMDNGFC
jgi:hypothetical protein